MATRRKLDKGNRRKRNDEQRRQGRLAGPTANGGSPEEFAGMGELGEAPEWHGRRASNPTQVKFKLINENGNNTYAVVFDKGDEVVSTLRLFVDENRLRSSHFTAIGAFSDVVLGFFDRDKKEFKRIPIAEQVEVLSLNGDITFENDKPRIHAHVVVGKSDGTAYGGHLLEAHVFPTLELILIESPKYLQRRLDEETGLALIDLDAA